MSIFLRRKSASQAEQIVLAAAAKARVELLIGEMSHNLHELRDILVEGKEPDAERDE